LARQLVATAIIAAPSGAHLARSQIKVLRIRIRWVLLLPRTAALSAPGPVVLPVVVPLSLSPKKQRRATGRRNRLSKSSLWVHWEKLDEFGQNHLKKKDNSFNHS